MLQSISDEGAKEGIPKAQRKMSGTSFSVVYLAHISLILYHYGLQVLTGGFRGLSQ